MLHYNMWKNKVMMLWYIKSFHCLKISKRNVYFELFFIVTCVFFHQSFILRLDYFGIEFLNITYV